MDKRTRSLIDELDNFVPSRDRHAVLEARANHVIASAINLLHLITENFDEEDSEKLVRRFFLAVKTQNPKKFENTVRQLREHARCPTAQK